MADIAALALRYVGTTYVYGGVPITGIGHWDCSSFVNWVVGHDAKQAIPGYAAGTYNGATHGPVVIDWATWSGATTTKTPARGDLVIWPGIGATGHIGIYLASNSMVSALDTAQGTLQTPINGYGPAGVPHIYRSLSGNSSASSGTPVSVTGCNPAMIPVAIAYNLVKHR